MRRGAGRRPSWPAPRPAVSVNTFFDLFLIFLNFSSFFIHQRLASIKEREDKLPLLVNELICGRPPVDHWVDRPEVQARQRAQPTGTNRPTRTHPTQPPQGLASFEIVWRDALYALTPDEIASLVTVEET